MSSVSVALDLLSVAPHTADSYESAKPVGFHAAESYDPAYPEIFAGDPANPELFAAAEQLTA